MADDTTSETPAESTSEPLSEKDVATDAEDALGYYDYGPRLALGRHLALTGLWTEETRTVGFRLAALLGLSVLDLDRRIEHGEGESIASLLRQSGEAAYRALERRHLERTLAARPFTVIVLGDGALIDPRTRRLCQKQSHLLALELDLPNFFWRRQAARNAVESGAGIERPAPELGPRPVPDNPESEPPESLVIRAVRDDWHPLYSGPLERFEQAREFYEARRPGLEAAEMRFPLAGRSLGDAVAALETYALAL